MIVELTLRCFPAITHRTGAVLPFASVRTAASAVVLLLRARPASLLRLELLNREGVEATNALFKTALPAAPHLFLEFASDGHGAAAALSADADAAASIALLQSAGGGVPTAAAGDGLDALWEARRGCYLAAFKVRAARAFDSRFDANVNSFPHSLSRIRVRSGARQVRRARPAHRRLRPAAPAGGRGGRHGGRVAGGGRAVHQCVALHPPPGTRA